MLGQLGTSMKSLYNEEGQCSVWNNVQSNLPGMHHILFSQSENFLN
jgi:hypothetical protein